jgi:transposase
MARPYFLDLRERVVALVARGETCRSVAAVFDVSVASVVKWSKSRATGSAAAKAMGGKRPHLLEGERSFLLGRLAEKPDLTLHALLSELRERGVAVSCDTLWRFLRREGVGFKKKRFSPASKIAPTSRGAAPCGRKSSCGSIQGAPSSSMRHGRRPI